MQQFLRDSIIAAVFLFGFLIFEHSRGLDVPRLYYLLAVALSCTLALATRTIAIRETRVGGWLYVLVSLGLIYLLSFHLDAIAGADIEIKARLHFAESYEIMRLDAERFKDAYIVVASAAFTLFGLLFVAARGLNTYVTVRVVAILVSFASPFLVAICCILFRDEPWWRLIAIVTNSSVLVAAGLTPAPWIANYAEEHPAVIAFWESWLTARRGWAMWPLFGIAVMPAYPVFGESLLCFGLIYQVYLGANGAATLYIIDQTKDKPDFEQILKLVLRIRIPKRISDAVATIQKGGANRRTTSVFYVPTPKAPTDSTTSQGGQH